VPHQLPAAREGRDPPVPFAECQYTFTTSGTFETTVHKHSFMLNDIYQWWILATLRELHTCTYKSIFHLYPLSHGEGCASFSTKLKSRFSFVPTAQLCGIFMGQISFFTCCRIACHIELGRLGGPPPTALLQSVYVHVFLVRCTIIA
jgi:hypothetical protein